MTTAILVIFVIGGGVLRIRAMSAEDTIFLDTAIERSA